MIDIVDYETLKGLEQSMEAAREPSLETDYARWKPWHDALRETAGRHGTVAASESEPGDVLALEDYAHLETDRFVLRTVKLVDPAALADWQREVARHHPNAALLLEGDPGSPLAPLMILITPAVILVASRYETSDACHDRLETLGAALEA